MNQKRKCISILLAFFSIFLLSHTINAQTEEYSGNVISFNGPRTRTAFFTLRINGRTSDEQARRFLGTLRNDGQEDLLDDIRNENLGSFSVGNQVARRVNVVRESTVDGRWRIFVVFERWLEFGEFRGGYQRSRDYPFSVIELYVDERTGRGEGTFIAAARIDWDEDSRTRQQTVEIENFAIYPAKLVNVTRRGRRP